MPETKLIIEQTEEMPGVLTARHMCLPHIWYYANMLMHWRCKYCGKLTHEEPTDGLRADEVEYKTVPPPKK